jgi:outer membrane protein assembly factor BamB
MEKAVTSEYPIRQPRWYAFPGFVVPVLIGLGLTMAFVGLGDDWSQYRGPNQDGISPERILKEWPQTGPEQVWKIPLQNGFSSIAISQGKAFTLVSRNVQGQSREMCIALNADTGQELWATAVGQAKYTPGADEGASDNSGGDGPRSTPAVNDNRVFVLNAYLGLYCLNRDTGNIEWQRNLKQDYGGSVIGWQNSASPTIDENLIFINVNSATQPLVALRVADGTEQWRGGRSDSDSTTHASPITATLHGVHQVIFITQYGLVSVESQTGQELWRCPFAYRTSTAASPVVCGDIVYCSAGYDVGAGAVRISKTGDSFSAQEIWRKPKQLMNQWSTPVYYEGYVYGIYGHGAHGTAPLKCVDVVTGNEKWSQSGFGPGGVLLVDGHVLVLSDYGDLVLVKASPTGYSESARFSAITGKCWNLAVVSNGRIYARSTQEGICLDVAEKTKAPLLLAPMIQADSGFSLRIHAADGTAIDPNRADALQVWTSTNAGLDLAQWSQITNSRTLTNGVLWMQEPSWTNWPQRFYMTLENP